MCLAASLDKLLASGKSTKRSSEHAAMAILGRSGAWPSVRLAGAHEAEDNMLVAPCLGLVISQFARVVRGVDLRSTAGNCAWGRAPQLTWQAGLQTLGMR